MSLLPLLLGIVVFISIYQNKVSIICVIKLFYSDICFGECGCFHFLFTILRWSLVYIFYLCHIIIEWNLCYIFIRHCKNALSTKYLFYSWFLFGMYIWCVHHSVLLTNNSLIFSYRSLKQWSRTKAETLVLDGFWLRSCGLLRTVNQVTTALVSSYLTK